MSKLMYNYFKLLSEIEKSRLIKTDSEYGWFEGAKAWILKDVNYRSEELRTTFIMTRKSAKIKLKWRFYGYVSREKIDWGWDIPDLIVAPLVSLPVLMNLASQRVTMATTIEGYIHWANLRASTSKVASDLTSGRTSGSRRQQCVLTYFKCFAWFQVVIWTTKLILDGLD